MDIAESGVVIDRIMLKDNTITMDTLASIRMKKNVYELFGEQLEGGKDYKDIGICQSPLSFSDGNACLTAIRARELSAKYSNDEELALPSANHECMNTCGCIRYMVIDKDIKNDNIKVVPKEKKTSNNTNKPSKKKVKGMVMW